jgi:hypothetical protein
MTKALVARREGDIFQARIFWRKAIRLLQPDTGIIKIGFESGPKGYDDIWTEYAPARAPNDPLNNAVLRYHDQCKYHVSHGEYGHADLIDPDFINAQTYSLMQRAHAAQRSFAPTGAGARFALLTNWQPRKGDALFDLIRSSHGGLDLDKLFGTKTDNSATGRVRKLWREHLGINDEELRVLSQTLAFQYVPQTLEKMREELNDLFPLVGLRQIPSNESIFPYDDLVIEWVSADRLEFNQGSLRAACEREGLVAAAPKHFVSYGVKTFEHQFDRLEDRCSKVLDLVSIFDERVIRDSEDWVETLYSRLNSFLHDAAKSSQQLQLALDVHASLAFAAGSILNVKSGRNIKLEQRSGGYELWSPTDCETDPAWPTWNFTPVAPAITCSDIVVAVGITHDIQPKVMEYIDRHLPGIQRFLSATLDRGASNTAIACGRHATVLAEALVAEINRVRQPGGRIHLFVSAPNAFNFFLGQRQPLLGTLILYEYDFEGRHGGSYMPSLSLPVLFPDKAGK